MDPDRFDRWTRTLARGVSRRRVLTRLGGGLAGGLLPSLGLAAADAAKGGNSACAQFCAPVFGADTPTAGQCTSQAAHGTGLCYQCGPAAAGSSQKPCDGSCVGTCEPGADVAALCACGEQATCCPVGCRCDFDRATNLVRCFDVRLIRDGGVPCATDADCPVGASCDTFSGLCDPDDCSDDPSACPAGAACSAGACFAYCSA